MKLNRMSFNAGEISPVLWWRSDLAKYKSSCQRVENFISLPQGGVRRRFGSENVFKLSDSLLSNGRVISWEVDRETYFQCVFLDTTIQIFNADGGLVETITGTPYTDDKLQDIYYKQVYDKMFLCHPDVPVQELTRTASTDWTLGEYEFNPQPFDEYNTDEIEITPTLISGFNYTLTANSNIFNSLDVGRVIKIDSNADLSDSGNYDTGSAGTTSTPLYATGVVTMRTEGGIWDGVLELQKKVGSGSWETIGSVTSEDGNHNGEILRDIDTFNTRVRVKMASRNPATSDSGCKWTIQIEDKQYTHYTITAYTSATVVTGKKYSGSATTTTTTDWAFGAFGGGNGYPTCVEIHEERMMLAGVLGTPATVYGSKVNDWVNFDTGTLATSAIKFTLGSDVRNRTRWLSTEKSLIMGTDYGEWSVGSRDGSTALSGENVIAQRHTQYGSASTQAVVGSDLTIYVEAGGRRIRSMEYNFAEKDGYVSNDMNILAPHLTENNKFVRLAYSRVPEQVVWALRDDGLICSFTYERAQQVTAWARHPMPNATVLDLNSFLTSDGDVVNMLVTREDGTYFEAIKPNSICLDWRKEYNMQDNYIASVNGQEDALILSDSLGESASIISTNEKNCFLRMITIPDDLVIKYQGVILGSDEIVPMGNNVYWLPTATIRANVSVFDFTTQLILDTDYLLNRNTLSGSGVRCLELITNQITVNDVDLFLNGSPLTLDWDYFNMTDIKQMLIIGTGTLTAEYNGQALNEDAYSVFAPQITFSSTQGTVHVGIEMTSLVETTEITNSPQSGGAGNTVRVDEVDVFVVDSVGGEVSVDGGQEYAPILQPNKNVTAGERIPPITGKQEVKTYDGYSDAQTITVRNSTPYNQIIASLGAKTKGYSQ